MVKRADSADCDEKIRVSLSTKLTSGPDLSSIRTPHPKGATASTKRNGARQHWLSAVWFLRYTTTDSNLATWYQHLRLCLSRHFINEYVIRHLNLCTSRAGEVQVCACCWRLFTIPNLKKERLPNDRQCVSEE